MTRDHLSSLTSARHYKIWPGKLMCDFVVWFIFKCNHNCSQLVKVITRAYLKPEKKKKKIKPQILSKGGTFLSVLLLPSLSPIRNRLGHRWTVTHIRHQVLMTGWIVEKVFYFYSLTPLGLLQWLSMALQHLIMPKKIFKKTQSAFRCIVLKQLWPDHLLSAIY